MLKNFSLKFVDIMVGIVLGLGFQWWPELHEPWQYIAFIFVYFDIVDYWIEYSPSLRKWPPKREIDVMLDISIMFSLFLYIYSTQLNIIYFLGSCILIRVFDYFWLLSSKIEYNPTGMDKTYIDTWLKLNLTLALATLAIVGIAYYTNFSSLLVLLAYFAARLVIRVFASLQYKKIHFT
ncbi:MAG: hypothetical protein Q7S43_00250 [bacterium]|nr:hypothetical protein [bacterium]